MEKNKIQVNVKLEKIDELKNLSKQLIKQCEQVESTIKEIRNLELELKI
ncbi:MULTISPECIES: hypothetical protein [unclassified Lactococcus]|nr:MULTISPECIES: hypothetical protein [unclassified Lactococcus]MQW24107.1 hypothetical protein [Lactococcus sp. dk101]